ncbi:MAG: cyclase family protein [Firmicutes bacterium]|nr:cyclase family protein [Bacillota bacterium]
MKTEWIYLSHLLTQELTGYRNTEALNLKKKKKISESASCNTSHLSLSSHFGTHIDFPYHFSDSGNKGENYRAGAFIFSEIKLVEINCLEDETELILTDHFQEYELCEKTEFIIIKTHYTYIRNQAAYYESNPGFHPELATYLKQKCPELKIIGFDSMSLSGAKNRDVGRIAHNEFLIKNDLLIVEDMDLSNVDSSTVFGKILVSPLRFKDSDGAPVTVFAEVMVD